MLSIKYLKDDLIESSGKRLADSKIRDSDIHWVLTVPAIWNDAAKQFMREAAEQVNACLLFIVVNRLLIDTCFRRLLF
jgi:molecular chaperone DnaK (HSP70)